MDLENPIFYSRKICTCEAFFACFHNFLYEIHTINAFQQKLENRKTACYFLN